MIRWAALPRAINAGKPLIMAELRALCERLGMADVSTILAPGNVVFTSDAEAQTIQARLERAVSVELGLDTAWFVPSYAVLAPFPGAVATRPNHVQVLFHGQALDLDCLRNLAVRYDGPERMQAARRDCTSIISRELVDPSSCRCLPRRKCRRPPRAIGIDF